MNLCDVEGRSACWAIPRTTTPLPRSDPFVGSSMVTSPSKSRHKERIALHIDGPEGYTLHGENDVSWLSRTLEQLIRATHGAHHQYLDGFMLYTGTLFAPTQDRDTES